MTKKTYDSGCYSLAEDFLEDEPGLYKPVYLERLAILIQETIEDFIEDVKIDLRTSEQPEDGDDQ